MPQGTEMLVEVGWKWGGSAGGLHPLSGRGRGDGEKNSEQGDQKWRETFVM